MYLAQSLVTSEMYPRRAAHLPTSAPTLVGPATTGHARDMTKLTPEQIAEHAHAAGFRGENLTTAVAVALAESGGKTDSHNTDGLDDSYGLWQINMYGTLGPDRRQKNDLDADRELFDPSTNADAAHRVFREDGGSFEPWGAYTNGSYRQFLDEARRAVRAQKDRKSPAKKDTAQDGFQVDPEALSGYVRIAGAMADDLASLSTRQLRGVRGLADDSFGRIGKETGFAAALDRFGESLQRQVKGIGSNADKLAKSVSGNARHYREQDSEIADDLMRLLRER